MIDAKIPTQVPDFYLNAMRDLAASLTGRGAIVECGAWLGAVTLELARGVQLNGSGITVHAFDHFEARGAEPEKASAQGFPLAPGENTLHHFERNLRPFPVVPHKGSILEAKWSTTPIELYVDDACKTGPVFAHAMRTFGPAFIPGVTRLALLDYNWLLDHHRKYRDNRRALYRYQSDFMSRYVDNFQRIGGNPAVFKYLGGLDFTKIPDYRSAWLHRTIHDLVQLGRRYLP